MKKFVCAVFLCLFGMISAQASDPFGTNQSVDVAVASPKTNLACPCCKDCPCTICKSKQTAKKQYRQVCENGICKMVPVEYSAMPVGPVSQPASYQSIASPKSRGGRFQGNGPVRKVFHRIFHRRR